MSSRFEELLQLLEVRLEAFAMCEIGAGYSLRCAPAHSNIVHFVLKGEGCVECEDGTYALRPGTLIVVPKQLPKLINGPAPITKVVDADGACALSPGIARFRACGAAGDLLLGCGAVVASVGTGLGLFEDLKEPVAESSSDPMLLALFDAMLLELERPGIGTKALLSTLMKQIFVVLLRTHLARRGTLSPLYARLMDPQLGRAVSVVLERPGYPHTVDSLAKAAGMSRSRFTSYFSATFGRTPMTFVQAARTRAAAILLRETDLPVKAVAAQVGYLSRSQFSRAFREQFGVDPTIFRKRSAQEHPAVNGTAAPQQGNEAAAECTGAAEFRSLEAEVR